MFTELPRTPFSAQTLSIDPRTIRLVVVAAKGKEFVFEGGGMCTDGFTVCNDSTFDEESS